MGQLSFAMGALAAELPMVIWMRQTLRQMGPLLRERPEDGGVGVGCGELEGRIAFREVSFGYQLDGPPIFDAVSFRIEPGEMVAIVGPSGAGKSTLIRLLLGFEHPSSGAILLDDQNLAHLDLMLVRRQLGVVLQNGGLIGASIFQNIAFAAPLTLDEAWEAARQAGLAHDIARMPMGMNTRVDGDGTLLSGGQRQRLMLARAGPASTDPAARRGHQRPRQPDPGRGSGQPGGARHDPARRRPPPQHRARGRPHTGAGKRAVGAKRELR